METVGPIEDGHLSTPRRPVTGHQVSGA